jgi:N utilization substance protein B
MKFNSKSITRIATIQIMYQSEVNQHEPLDLKNLILRITDFYQDPENLKEYHTSDDKVKIRLSAQYLNDLVLFSHDNIDKIDEMITSLLVKQKSLKDVPILLLCILRVGIGEIMFFPETPIKVIINEYTDIAKDMIEESKIGLVNSILENAGLKIRS